MEKAGVESDSAGTKEDFPPTGGLPVFRPALRPVHRKPCEGGRPGEGGRIADLTQRREGKAFLSVPSRKVAHFWQNFSASAFSVCSCSNSLVAAGRAAARRLCDFALDSSCGLVKWRQYQDGSSALLSSGFLLSARAKGAQCWSFSNLPISAFPASFPLRLPPAAVHPNQGQ